MDKIDYSKILSVQPFWKAEKVNKLILTDPSDGTEIAVLYEIVAGDGNPVLKSLPGIGLVGITFALNQDYPRAFCCGTLKKVRDIPLFGASHTLLCHFMPGEFTNTFHVPSSVATDTEVPMEDLLHLGSLSEEVALTDSFSRQAELIYQFIMQNRYAKPRLGKCFLAEWLIYKIIASRGNLRSSDIEKESGYSARHIQQVCEDYVGLSPKQECVNVRFQHTLRIMTQNPKIHFAEISGEAGFYDQPHFIKTFKNYTGLTPLQYIKLLNENSPSIN